jgi:thiamine pyrophosphate-dependent acetolactate synthase large subunit-like protein
MVALLHGAVGIQDGAMAIYNAYADRVPVLLIAGLDYDGHQYHGFQGVSRGSGQRPSAGGSLRGDHGRFGHVGA